MEGLTPNPLLSGPAVPAALGKCAASGVPRSLPPYKHGCGGGRRLSFNAIIVALATQEILAVGVNLATMVG